MKKYPIVQKIIAHRGVSADFLENTLRTLEMSGPVPLLFVAPWIEVLNMGAYFRMAVQSISSSSMS